MTYRRGQLTVGLVLLCAASATFAAPRFIAGSNVTRDAFIAEISVNLACGVEYIDHLPARRGDKLRIHVEPTAICNGVSPLIAQSRQQHRPLGADLAKIVQINYDGDTASGPTLTLVFSETVSFDIEHSGASSNMNIRVYLDAPTTNTLQNSRAGGTRVPVKAQVQPQYVINLSSSRQPHAESEKAVVEISPGLELSESEIVLAGVSWYRLRLGQFRNMREAQLELVTIQETFPTAWIDRASRMAASNVGRTPQKNSNDLSPYAQSAALASIGLDQVDQLMADARKAMVAGQVSKAVQIYTKVLRAANHDRHAEAQEYLALAREKKGQKAHAKAEYQRYLLLYPDSDGAGRVSQRLAALLASDRRPSQTETAIRESNRRELGSGAGDWRIQTFFSQYYRRDVNQLNEEDDVVSQSALYSDVNVDARRRGQRFDFSSRLSAGYRNDFLGDDVGSGNDLRISYAYADLADAETRLRGRIGRQSRNSSGVLGRFDGLNLSYQASERIFLNAVAGKPVNSDSDGIDSEKTFYGTSANFGPILGNLELGLFYVKQNIEGIDDRQAIGTEFRYFGENQSLWGLVDYDTSHNEIGSTFVQGSWRFASHLTLHGSVDRRHSPYLSTGNALIGQPVQTFSELMVLMTEEEIRQLSLDRTPLTTSYTLGLSHSLSPKLQINADANQTTIEATPESGGVAATPQATYSYFSTTVVASSLLREGDVSMISLRLSDSDTATVVSLNLDSRFPLGRSWRINPRFRIDRRQIMSDSSHEWLFTPGLRIQFRRGRRYRIEFEAGKRFSQHEVGDTDMNRESYFLNIGYQAFF